MARLESEKKDPRFFTLVPKPADVSEREIAKGQPIYIDGLTSGGGVSQGDFDALVARVVTLEADVTALKAAANG